MGVATDLILVSAVNPGAGPTVAAPANNGDSLTVKSFSPPDRCYLETMIRQGTTAGFFGVRSVNFHDNNRGIRVTPAESPSLFSLPAEYSQTLVSGDVLTAELSGGAAETDVGVLGLFYTNTGGSNARLVMPGDIGGNIKTVKPLTVAVTSPATIGTWSDTGITTTENLLKAGKDYAVLGYMSNANLAVIAIKGADTGNYRVGGPGSTSELATTDYFVAMSNMTGRPHIPVINASNAANTLVSVAASTASVAAVVELILVELVNNLPSN